MRKDITIILVGISVVGLVAGYWAAITYLPEWFVPSSTSETVGVPLAEGTGEVAESSLPGRVEVRFSQATAAVGEEVKAEIILNTGGATINGFDLLLSFDQEAWVALTPQVAVSETEAFAVYPVNEVSPQAGTVRLSGLTNPESGFTGELTVGSFLLSPQKPGKLGVTVVFEGVGVGTDTNLAEKGTGEDILGGVENGTLEVR